MESNPKASLCYSAVNTVDENQELIIREGIESFIREAPQGDVYKRLFAGNFIMTVSTMFRQEVFSSWVYKHCPIRLDYFLFLNAAFQGDVIFINERMCSYRKTPTGAMATKSQWVGEQSFHTKEFFILMSSIGIVSKQSDPHLSKMDGLIRYLRFAQHLEFEKKMLKNLLYQGKINIIQLFIAYLKIKIQNLHHKIVSINLVQ